MKIIRPNSIDGLDLVNMLNLKTIDLKKLKIIGLVVIY
jgi:hypothetical protein